MRDTAGREAWTWAVCINSQTKVTNISKYLDQDWKMIHKFIYEEKLIIHIWKLRSKDCELEASLASMIRSCHIHTIPKMRLCSRGHIYKCPSAPHFSRCIALKSHFQDVWFLYNQDLNRRKSKHDKLRELQRLFPGTELCHRLTASFQSPHLRLYFLEVKAATRRQVIMCHGDINSVCGETS